MGRCRHSAPHLFEPSSKDFSEADRYTRSGRLYRSPDRCCSGGVRRHTSAGARESEGGNRCDRITFFLCLRGMRKTTNSIARQDCDIPAGNTSKSFPQGALVLDQVTGRSVSAKIGVDAASAASANRGGTIASLLE